MGRVAVLNDPRSPFLSSLREGSCHSEILDLVAAYEYGFAEILRMEAEKVGRHFVRSFYC